MSSMGRPIPGRCPRTFTPCRMAFAARLAASMFLAQGSNKGGAHRAAPAVTRSDVAFRWLDVLALFELGQPRIGFVGAHMQAGGAVLLPCLECVLPECVALFLALDVLGDRLVHEPVSRAVASNSQPFHAGLGVVVDLDRHRANGSSSHWHWHWQPPFEYLRVLP